MRLPPSATGFGAGLPGADLPAFLAVCHHAARRVGGTVTRATPAGVTPSFHTVLIDHPGGPITALGHATVPMVAFAQPLPAGDTKLAFLDHPDLAVAVGEVSDLRVLTVEALRTPLSAVDLAALRAEEHRQIRYWRPETVGELLFNFWD
ncbi:hypothetical protein ABZV78_16110 [Micromonospora sp. NPDC004540]|uniref:hypothetical protein n=1 Tax=Micromonospora sp. NPDC004540 TaxID=3154457 RepID=UPI0033B5FFD2